MSNLFTAVSVEQQEIVAGGLSVRANNTYEKFTEKYLSIDYAGSSAGPNGASSFIKGFDSVDYSYIFSQSLNTLFA
ncbi:MAG: CTB family bacteriocin [Nostocales cyanobacterium ELA583]|jgi:hypothetical protein